MAMAGPIVPSISISPNDGTNNRGRAPPVVAGRESALIDRESVSRRKGAMNSQTSVADPKGHGPTDLSYNGLQSRRVITDSRSTATGTKMAPLTVKPRIISTIELARNKP